MPGASYDFIVVGGGHNGLVAASILAMAGARVLVAAPRLGGLAGPSASGSLGPAYSVGLFPESLSRLLGVDPAEWLEVPEPSWLVVEGGEVVFRWWGERSRLEAEFREAGAGDEGARLLGMLDLWRRCAAPLLLYSLDPPSLDEAAALVSERCGEELGEAVARRASEVLLPGSPWLQGLLAYPILLDEPGYSTLYLNSSMGVWGLPREHWRGSVSPLEAVARRLGVDFYRGWAWVVVKDGRAAAARLSDGRLVEARKGVVYAGHIACLSEYVEGEGPWRGEVEEASRRALSAATRIEGPARFNAHLSSRPEPPARGERGQPIVEVWGGGYWGEAVYMEKPGGGWYVAFTGYPGSPGSLRRLLEDLGVEPESVERLEDLGPLAQEAEHCNPGGRPNHIPLTKDYILSKRPMEGWAGYKTSVEGLYHASASSHPGGQVTGIPGYNAARRILRDLGIKAPPELEKPSRQPFRGVAEAAKA